MSNLLILIKYRKLKIKKCIISVVPSGNFLLFFWYYTYQTISQSMKLVWLLWLFFDCHYLCFRRFPILCKYRKFLIFSDTMEIVIESRFCTTKKIAFWSKWQNTARPQLVASTSIRSRFAKRPFAWAFHTFKVISRFERRSQYLIYRKSQ